MDNVSMEKQKPKRKHNPEWKDSNEQKAARQRTRYQKQTDIAAALGYSSWAKLVTAIINGDVKVIKK